MDTRSCHGVTHTPVLLCPTLQWLRVSIRHFTLPISAPTHLLPPSASATLTFCYFSGMLSRLPSPDLGRYSFFFFSACNLFYSILFFFIEFLITGYIFIYSILSRMQSPAGRESILSTLLSPVLRIGGAQAFSRCPINIC